MQVSEIFEVFPSRTLKLLDCQRVAGNNAPVKHNHLALTLAIECLEGLINNSIKINRTTDNVQGASLDEREHVHLSARVRVLFELIHEDLDFFNSWILRTQN